MYKHTLLKVNQFESFIAKPIYCTFANQTHNENYSYSLRWVFMLQHLMVYLIFFFFPEKHIVQPKMCPTCPVPNLVNTPLITSCYKN